MLTTIYLIRHAATAANLAIPNRLQGRRTDPPLAPFGICQAEATRDLLAGRRLHACYSSPLRRAVETANVIAAPHRVIPMPVADLIECDIGEWEGLDWETIKIRDAEIYRRYMADQGAVPYPGGESFADVRSRAAPAIDRIIADHPGQTVLIVSHHVVNRTYLAGLFGLPVREARRVRLDNCGVSVVTSEAGQKAVTTLNAAFHLSPRANSPA